MAASDLLAAMRGVQQEYSGLVRLAEELTAEETRLIEERKRVLQIASEASHAMEVESERASSLHLLFTQVEVEAKVRGKAAEEATEMVKQAMDKCNAALSEIIDDEVNTSKKVLAAIDYRSVTAASSSSSTSTASLSCPFFSAAEEQVQARLQQAEMQEAATAQALLAVEEAKKCLKDMESSYTSASTRLSREKERQAALLSRSQSAAQDHGLLKAQVEAQRAEAGAIATKVASFSTRITAAHVDASGARKTLEMLKQRLG